MRILTKEAQEDRDEFNLRYANIGCTCFLSPSCSHCTHPGNPLCQEDDSCWEDVDLICVDNTGLEDKFDLGVEYKVEDSSENEFVYAYDKHGIKGTFFRNRFEIR
jgi:hypothetical protein